MELYGVIRRIIEATNKSEIDYVIVGGIAVILKGRLRTTNDVDLIVSNNPQSFKKFLTELQKQNFDVNEEQAEFAIQENFNFTVFDNLTPYRLDIKLAKRYNDQNVLEAAETYGYRDIEIKIAPIEWILFGKLSYLGSIIDLKDNQILNLNDALDFISVWKENTEVIDVKWIKKKCEEEKLSSTLNRLLKIIEKIEKKE